MNNHLEQYVKEYLIYLQVEKNLAPRTLEEYNNDLNLLVAFLLQEGLTDWNHVTHRHLRQFLHYLQEIRKNSATARARKISSLKGFFTFLYEEQFIDTNPALRLRKPKMEKKLPAYLSMEDCKRFIQVVREHSAHHPRDLTIILLFLYTGIRLSELTSLQVQDIDLQTGSIRIYGKGRKERMIPLIPSLVRHLKEYLNFRKSELGEKASAFTYLFYTDRNQTLRPLHRRTVHDIFLKYSKLAAINEKHFRAHKLRHTFATLLYTQGVNLLEIKQLLGHTNLSTTEIYTHLSPQQLKDAVSKHPLHAKDKNE